MPTPFLGTVPATNRPQRQDDTMTTTFSPAPVSSQHASPAAPRFDMYEGIHKGLRLFMADTLARVGRVDVFDAAELSATIAQLDGLLNFCASHVKHENEFVHAALQARTPGACSRTADDHEEHLESIEILRMEAAQLMAAGEGERMALALRLYRHLALFVAENLQHMHVEETANNASLWACYTDAELVAIHDRLLASIAPDDMMTSVRWIVPGLSPVQRAGMLGEMKAGMPAPAFAGVLALVKPHLDAAGWTKLSASLALAA
jgi:hypothetical protein